MAIAVTSAESFPHIAEGEEPGDSGVRGARLVALGKGAAGGIAGDATAGFGCVTAAWRTGAGAA